MRPHPKHLSSVLALLLFASAAPAGAAATDAAAPDHDAASTRAAVSVSASSDGSGCPAPATPVPVPSFGDIAGSTHASNIRCVASWGIASGTTATTYAPRRDVTRAQMATFVANLIRATGTSLPTGRDRFGDDAGSPHEANINALANAGVISGTGGGRYQPNRNVTRAQAATILAGTYRHLTDTDLPVGADRFGDDDGSPHEANINRLANAGVINGLTTTRFGHAESLKRDQMASLLARFLPLATGGTIWYSDAGGLYAIDPARSHRRLVFSAPHPSPVDLHTYTVNPQAGEFTYLDPGPGREFDNRVHIRSTADTAPVTSFEWPRRCDPADGPREAVSAPLASPDGRWFAAQIGHDIVEPAALEIRTRSGDCVITFPPGVVATGSWSWFDDGSLLVAMDSTYLGTSGDWALARFPRQALQRGDGTVTVLRTFRGDAPTSTAVAHGQGQVAYSWNGDLYVFDLDFSPGSDPAARPHHRIAHGTGELMWPAFAPDDRSIALRHDPGASAPGRVHVVPNRPGTSTPVRSGGATQLEVPPTPGSGPSGFDARGPLVWSGAS